MEEACNATVAILPERPAFGQRPIRGKLAWPVRTIGAKADLGLIRAAFPSEDL